MPEALASSQLVRDANDLLLQKHAGEQQKVNGRPYAAHPIDVATDVGSAGFDAEMIAAALLHDIVEDSDITVEALRERFGERVADLVEAMTDGFTAVTPYERRKRLHRAQVAAAGADAVAIYAADKLANVRALRAAYAEDGEGVARRFNQPLDAKLRVWEEDSALVCDHADSVPYAGALRDEVEGLRADLSAPRRAG